MKSTTVTLGLFAGIATASAGNHPRFHHQWRRNDTATYPVVEVPIPEASDVPGPSDVPTTTLTTLTVEVTQTQTITSCAPTVTNCPILNSNSTAPGGGTIGTAIVTEIVGVTTIVCPVTDVASVSSSIVNDYSSGLIPGSTSTLNSAETVPAPGVPVVTETGYPTVLPPGATVSPSTGVVDETLTMTLGPESSKTILVTTIQSTYTEMVTITSTLEGASDELTTTTTRTSTGTRTVTVPESTGTGTIIPIGNEGPGDEGECVNTTVTVTETVPASTVYVTIGNDPTTAPTPEEIPTDGGDDVEDGDEEDGEDYDDEDEEDDGEDVETGDECPTGTATGTSATADVTQTQTATVVPYPIGNDTYPVVPGPTAYPTLVAKPRSLYGKN